jgi:hypothetical protein
MTFVKTTATKNLTDKSKRRLLGYVNSIKSSWRLRQILLLSFYWCAICITIPCAAQTSQDHEIKALFLYNFANFVFWPSSAFESPTSPLRYCVLGNSKVVDTLTNLIDGEKVGSRPLTLQRVNTLAEMENCHILFLNAEENGHYAAARQIQAKGVLTVSDGDSFAAQGGMISLVRDSSNRVRPVINIDAVKAAQLRISAKLLRLAKLI